MFISVITYLTIQCIYIYIIRILNHCNIIFINYLIKISVDIIIIKYLLCLISICNKVNNV